MTRLALFGGPPIVPGPLPEYPSIGVEERLAVQRVVESGCLSAFHGSPGANFLGGVMVRAFEEAWCRRFGVSHAVSMNSATSGLIAAVGAAGIGPGDEVIVPPWTMSATVAAPLFYGAIPVFADIEADTFCLDPAAVRACITPRTRAILAVNLFGQPASLFALKEIARQHSLLLIEDNAQGPLAALDGRYAGTIGDIGVFSLNFHKHVHTGEGGMCVTNDDRLATRLQLIRNHAESIVEGLDVHSLVNMVGFNFRMTELSAAIGIEQLKKIDRHVERREALARALTAAIADLRGLVAPIVRQGARHVYYVWAIRVEESVVGVSRNLLSRALAAEGFVNATGYVRPLYLLPLFQQRIAIGGAGYPFTLAESVSYAKGICPVVERLHERELILYETCASDIDDRSTGLLCDALRKVYRHRDELRARGAEMAGRA
jgi:perosamine synthetase